MDVLWEYAGWTGAVAILGAFLAVSMGWWTTGSRFQAANLFGACAFIANGAFHEAWPSVMTNIAWFLISAVALFRMRSAAPAPVAARRRGAAHLEPPTCALLYIMLIIGVTAMPVGVVVPHGASCGLNLGFHAPSDFCFRYSQVRRYTVSDSQILAGEFGSGQAGLVTDSDGRPLEAMPAAVQLRAGAKLPALLDIILCRGSHWQVAMNFQYERSQSC